MTTRAEMLREANLVKIRVALERIADAVESIAATKERTEADLRELVDIEKVK